jgi:hypothetical protein
MTVLGRRCHAVVEAPDAGTVTVRVARHAIVKAPDMGTVTVRVARHAIVKAPDMGTVTVRVGRHAIVKAPDARSVVHWSPLYMVCLTRTRAGDDAGEMISRCTSDVW